MNQLITIPQFALLFLILLQSQNATAQCCTYKLLMHDSYGDGWNGATLEVLVNSVSIGTFSASNTGSTASFSVCNGNNFELIYTPGAYENENSYELLDSTWNLVFQANPNPNTGSVFSSVGNCNSLLVPGSHPCTAVPIDTGPCIFSNNNGFLGSGLNANCANYTGGDIWFTMQVPASGNLSFETDNGNITDSGLAIWRGNSCTNPIQLACDDDSGNGYYSFLQVYDLTPDETIYIQVFGYNGASGSFDICVTDLGKITLDSTELPMVLINTLGQTIVPEVKINAMMDIKYNGVGNITHITDPSNIYSGNIGIEIRGASSSGYPQKPYNFETRTATGANNNVSLFGMPAENDWVLISNYNDRSLMRNTLAYKLFGEMGHYSVRTSLCEVLIDSSYKGIYVLAEKIKRDNNRVDIAKLTTSNNTGNSVTGGYILEQNLWNPNNSFQSNYSPIDHPGFDVHFVYKEPDADSITIAQKNYIASFVDSLEDALYSANFIDPVNGYRKFLDTESFIDYFIVNELARNNDGFKKSVYFHKDKYSKGGKLKAGPVWDFDWAWKNMYGCSIFENITGTGWAHHINDCPTDNYSCGYYIRLMQDSTFNNELRCRYESFRASIMDTSYLFNYMDSIRNLVQNAQARHFQKWPILGVSGPAPEVGAVAASYNAEIDTLKHWISERLDWLDANIPGTCPLLGIPQTKTSDKLNCYPNPANDYFIIDYNLASTMNVSLRLYNSLGSEVFSKNLGKQSNGQYTFNVETKTFPSGVYILRFESGNEIISKKIVINRL